MNELGRFNPDAARSAPVTRVTVGANEMSEALVDGFRTGRLPSPAETAATVFARIDAAQRAALLSVLLKFVSPLALGVLAAGSFAKYMFRERWTDVAVPLEDIRKVSPGQVAELARYVEQSNPEFVRLLSGWLSSHPGALLTLGAGAIAVLLQFVAQRRAQPARGAAARGGTAPAPVAARAAKDDPDWLDD